MADISISLNNVQNVKTVNIEGLGVIRARRLGSGEELDLSTRMRRTGKILDELSAMDFTKFDTSNPEELKKLKRLTKRAELLSDELDDIKRFEFNTFKRCMSDEKDGEVVDVIMNTLTDRERGELFKQIFGVVKQIDAPDTEKIEVETNDTPEEKQDA